jgi:4'-phosphopantetheinyl transferase EntD
VPERALIEAILVPEVMAEEAFGDLDGSELFPEESALVARAVSSRRLEFATGRACARRALMRLGIPAAPILRSKAGEPTWPPGIVGSITHCVGYRACAVADARQIALLGIDAEPNRPLPHGVLHLIGSEREIASLPTNPTICWDRLLFSAKEAIYKAWFPIGATWLEFDEVDISFDLKGGFLGVLSPTETKARKVLHGRWTVQDNLLMTAVFAKPASVPWAVAMTATHSSR